MPIIWSCILWSVAWLAFLHLALTFGPVEKGWGVSHRIITAIVVTVVAIYFVSPLVRVAYKKEKASTLSGYLVARNDGKNHANDEPKLQLGDGGAYLVWSGKEGKSMVEYRRQDYSDKLTLKMVNGRVQLSTTVRDNNGNLIVEVIKNHWIVSPLKSYCWDKNYTDDALEVKDGRGRVVLQVKLLPDTVQLQVEWSRSSGKSTAITVQGQYSDEDGIMPMFQYPSDLYWGEYKDLSRR